MEDKKLFAMKIIDKRILDKPKSKQKMLSEINLHKSLKHRSICLLERVFQDKDNVYMLLQLCSTGNMFDMLRRRKRLTIPQVQYYIYQLIDGLCYLHSHKIIHRDIKLGNLLINDRMQLKLADFGLATKLQFEGDRKHTVCGTPNYIAPEVIQYCLNGSASGHSYEVDVWSTGVIMYFMLIGRAPFQSANGLQRIYDKICKAQFDFPQSFSNVPAKDLIRKILVVDVSKRYTFQQILSHEFMNPKHGIPKQIPVTSITVAPKFDSKCQKLVADQLKDTARNLSINTLRSEIDLSMQSIDENKPLPNKDGTKSIKGLLKTVFSTSSLSRSLQKLDNIGRNTTPNKKFKTMIMTTTLSRQPTQNKTDNIQQSSRVNRTLVPNTSLSQPPTIIRSSRLTTQPPLRNSNNIQQSPLVYILSFKKDIIFSYMLNTGYVGTYEPTYTILYNKTQKIYFEASNDQPLKPVKQQMQFLNENIQNRTKFMFEYLKSSIECEPYTTTNSIIYLRKIFEVPSEKMILFKLSNGSIQAHNYDTQNNLIVTDNQLILLNLRNGIQVGRHIQKKQNYVDSKNKGLIAMYLKVKKINAQINNMKK